METETVRESAFYCIFAKLGKIFIGGMIHHQGLAVFIDDFGDIFTLDRKDRQCYFKNEGGSRSGFANNLRGCSGPGLLVGFLQHFFSIYFFQVKLLFFRLFYNNKHHRIITSHSYGSGQQGGIVSSAFPILAII